MSHNSLHIQEISSRTFNNDPSIMETSIEHFERPYQSHNQKFDMSKMSLNKTINASFEELKAENQSYKKELAAYRNRILEMQRLGGSMTQESYMLELMQGKDQQVRELNKNYHKAIGNLKQTMDKNSMLSREVARLSKKLRDSELNYSRQKEVLQKSQNLISNLSITKSNYEIQLVNMQDSLIILEKEKNKISETNEQYEEKLALISQEIERLRIQLEKTRKENQMLRFNLDDAAQKVKKYQSETIEHKSILERLRAENRELNSKFSSLAAQLREHHEKLTYKDSIINDLKDGKAVLERTLKDKETHLKKLQAKLQEMEKLFKGKEEEFSRQANSYAQELGKVRAKLSEQNSSNKQIVMQKQLLMSEQQEIIQRYGLLKDQLERKVYETHALAEQLKSVEKERDLQMREREALLAENDQLGNLKGELMNEMQKMKNELLRWQVKYQETELTFRKCEEKERQLIREYQSKFDLIAKQKNSELGVKNHEISQCKYELTARTQEVQRLKGQISSLVEQEKRKLEEHRRDSNEEINELKGRLLNSEKLLEQGRRERDMLIQENSNILENSKVIEKLAETKNIQLRNCSYRLEELGRTVQELNEHKLRQCAEIQSYKRLMMDNQRVIADLSQNINQSHLRIQQLQTELRRTSTLFKEKETENHELRTRLREQLSSSTEKENEINTLKNSNERMAMALGRAEEFKSNFQLLLQEIERLNQIIVRKQSEIKQLRLQISQLVQKIDGLGHEQLKIMKAIETAYSKEVDNSQEIRFQFNDLKEYISRINERTSTNLKDLHEQSNSITSQLNRNEVDQQKAQRDLQVNLLETNRMLMIKENKNNLLQEQVLVLKERLAKQEEGLGKQEQILEKITELSRENSVVKEKLMHFRADQEAELLSKNISIANFESQISQLEMIQKKEVAELKLFFAEKEKRLEEQQMRSIDEISRLRNQLMEGEKIRRQKEKVIAELQSSLQQVTPLIDSKMREMQVVSRELQINAGELERYKQMLNTKNRSGRESTQLEETKKEVESLMKIISLREEQVHQNQAALQSLHHQISILSQNLEEQKLLARQQKLEAQLQIQQLNLENTKTQDQLKEAQEAVILLERIQSQKDSGASARLGSLFEKNLELQKQIRVLHVHLRQYEKKIASAKQQTGTLSHQLYDFIDRQNKSIDKLQSAGMLQKEKEELLLRIAGLEEEMETISGQANQLKIENVYLRTSLEQSKSFLQSYELKTTEVDREYVSLKQVYSKLSQEYSRLQLKNHEFEIELRKADVLQQKIQVMNGEINRLSKEKIELNEEVSFCKLALSGEAMAERRVEEQFLLIVLLMAEVESLRSRLAVQENEIKSSRIAQLSPYRK